MKITKYILLAASVMTLGSCAKFLDIKPAGKLIPEKGDVASFDRLLNNTNTISWTYQNNNRGSILMYLTDDLELSDNQAKFAWYDGHPNIDCYFAHIFKQPYGNPDNQDYYWNWGTYRQAQYFNACIDGVNSVRTDDVAEEADEIVAQATVARAWTYFYATLGYGPVYKPGQDNSAKTIPYRTQSDVMGAMEDLSTQQQVFDRVLSDIHTHYDNLPDIAASNTRFGKVQANAFLAFYHLFTRNYDSVAYYANRCLTMAASQNGGMDNLFYDMNLFSWADADKVAEDPDNKSTSSINTSQGEDPVTASYNREICLYRKTANAPSTDAYPSAEFLALFDEAYDLRREYLFFEYNGYKTTDGGVTYDDGRKVLNYQTKVAQTCGFSYPEILLMRAEGYARTNQADLAVADLNYLRKFRMKPGFTTFTESDPDKVMQEIVNERRRELPVGSPKRFFDLKRFVLDTGKSWCKQSITHVVEGQTYTAEVDSDYFVLPIRNAVLKWNPQWGIELDTTPWSNSK